MRNSVNLLPSSANDRFRRGQAKTTWIQVIVIAASITAFAVMVGQSASAQKQIQIAKRQAEGAKSKAVYNANGELTAQLKQISQWADSNRRLRGYYSPLVVLDLLSCIKEEIDGKMEVEQFTFETRKATDSTPSGGSVVIGLKTDSASNSARIVQAMQDQSLFSEVKLESALQQVVSENGDLKFSIKCTF